MKSSVKVAILSLCLLTVVSFAYAGGGRGRGSGAGSGKSGWFGRGLRDGSGPINTTRTVRPNYVDQNSDGICDNAGARIAGAGYGRGKGYGAGNGGRGMRAGGFGRGVRDGSGPINTTGAARPNYVDANGDGICDKKIPTN